MHAFHCILTIFYTTDQPHFLTFISFPLIQSVILLILFPHRWSPSQFSLIFVFFTVLGFWVAFFSLLAWSNWHFSQRDLSKMYVVLQTFHHWPFAYLSSLASFLICVTLILSSRLLQSIKYALLPFFSRSSYTLSLLYRVSFFFSLHRVWLKWSLMRFQDSLG